MLPTFGEVQKAYEDCVKRKRNTPGAQQFAQDLERNLRHLHQQLCDQTYEIGITDCFVSTKPKPREIWAGAFRDRVVHHLMYNRLFPDFYRTFSHYSCACIPGRGPNYGAEKLEKRIRSVTQNWSEEVFYLKMDLSNFFVSINKDILWALLETKVRDQWTVWITKEILYHDPNMSVNLKSPPRLMALVPAHKKLSNAPERTGLPIGNLSSQFFANVYMNLFDQYVQHVIKPKGYARYVDDFVLLHDDPQWLLEAKGRMEEFLQQRLAVTVNPKKTILQPVSRGVDFVGQVIKPWRRVARGRTVNSSRRNFHKAKTPEERRASANSFMGLLRQTRSYNERAEVARTAKTQGHPCDRGITKLLLPKP